MGLRALPEFAWRAIGFAATLVTFGLVVELVLTFDPEQIGLQHVEFIGWRETFGARMLLGVDGIGLCFLASTAGLVPLAVLSSRSPARVGASFISCAG